MFMMAMGTRPPITSVITAPRYGTWMMSTSAMILSSSPPICCGVPTPGCAYDSLPGCAFASAISSRKLFAGRSLLTAMMLAMRSTSEIGAKSRSGS